MMPSLLAVEAAGSSETPYLSARLQGVTSLKTIFLGTSQFIIHTKFY